MVTDVGSTKRVVAAALADERFIGGHPLAGAETAGVEHAREDLFEGAVWYLTPAGNSSGVLYERLHRLLTAIGARPAAIDADDARPPDGGGFAPAARARQRARRRRRRTRWATQQEARVPAVGPSFRDATRVAGANSAIWTDIYVSNRDALVAAIDAFAAELAVARDTLQSGDAQAITRWNERARAARDGLLGAGATGGPVRELRVAVPNRPGVIAEIALALGRAGVNIVDMALSPSQDNRQGVVALWIGGDEQAGARGAVDRAARLPRRAGMMVRA